MTEEKPDAGVSAQALGSLTERVWLADRWQSWLPLLRRLAVSPPAVQQIALSYCDQDSPRQLDDKSGLLAHRRPGSPDAAEMDVDQAGLPGAGSHECLAADTVEHAVCG